MLNLNELWKKNLILLLMAQRFERYLEIKFWALKFELKISPSVLSRRCDLWINNSFSGDNFPDSNFFSVVLSWSAKVSSWSPSYVEHFFAPLFGVVGWEGRIFDIAGHSVSEKFARGWKNFIKTFYYSI